MINQPIYVINMKQILMPKKKEKINKNLKNNYK